VTARKWGKTANKRTDGCYFRGLSFVRPSHQPYMPRSRAEGLRQLPPRVWENRTGVAEAGNRRKSGWLTPLDPSSNPDARANSRLGRHLRRPPCSRLPLAMSKEISMEVRRDSTIYRRPRPGSAVVAVRSANIHTHKRTTQHNGDRKVTATVTPELLLFKFWFRWRRRGRLCRPNLDDNLRIFGILRGGSERRRTGSVH
jgi:hypothetical protein